MRPRITMLAVAVVATASARAPEITGIWGVELTFPPAAHGMLSLVRHGAAWSASIDGADATPRAHGDSVEVDGPHGRGMFRGVLAADRRTIDGFWIQPEGRVNGVAYAMPLTLRRRQANEWHGVVVPLAESYSLYAVIARDAGDSLTAVFRNPERNDRGGASRFRVRTAGDSVWFVDPARPDHVLPGRMDTERRTLTVRWAPLDTSLVLTRRARDHALGLVPSVATVRVTDAPPVTGDGWRTARAADVGLDAGALAAMLARFDSSSLDDAGAPLVHAMLVARHGRLVLERYFRGYGRESLHDLRSASKAMNSVLLGAAMAHAVPVSPSTPVYAAFGGVQRFAYPDSGKARITLGDLLTHSSGLACDDNDDSSPGNEDRMQSQTAQPDWERYTLDLPLVHEPGAQYAYCSATMNLAGGVLRRATGLWLPEAFERWVGRPLQFGRYAINLTPAAEGYGGGGMRMRPRDLLKVGQLYLDGGVWNGRRVVSVDWVARSTAAVVTDSSSARADGYGWHLNTIRVNGHAYREYEANGNGGQFLIVLPDLDMAVVFTAGNYGQYGIWRQLRDDIVAHGIIPAVIR